MQIVCGKCHSPNVERYVSEQHNMYHCRNCGHDDSRVIGAQGDFAIEQTIDGKIQHRSAVTIVLQNGKVLFLDRRNRPFGFSFPGGHVDYGDGNDYALAAQRELREESGLIADKKQLQLLIEFPLADQQCHASPDIEIWHVYLLHIPDGPQVAVTINEEHNGYRWIPVAEVPLSDVTVSAKEAIEKIWNKVNEANQNNS